MTDEEALRVTPLAKRVVDLLLTEADVNVRRVALKCVKAFAADHWPAQNGEDTQ